MANTVDADLIVDRLADGVITPLQDRLPGLMTLSRNFGVDPLAKRATVQVEKVTAGTAATTNPTNYASGDTTNTNVAVTVSEHSTSFHITSQEFMQRQKLMNKLTFKTHQLANAVWDVVAALLDEATFTNTVVVATEAAIAESDLQEGWGSVSDGAEINCVLSGPAYSNFLPTNRDSFRPGESGAYGFDTFVHANRWSAAAQANTRGYFADPNAIAIAAGVPELHPLVQQDVLGVRTVTLPGIGLPVQIVLWVDTNTRNVWASLGTMFGAAVGDATALTLYQTS